MRSHILILLLGLFLLEAGCSTPIGNTFKEINVDNIFSISIPDGLDSTSELHDFAGLQLMNKSQAFFLLALKEKKDAIVSLKLNYRLEEYAWFASQNICKDMDTCIIGNEGTRSINDLECMDREFIGILPSQKKSKEVFYRISVFESDDYFIQIICWTTRKNAFRYKATIDKIIDSVHIIPTDTLQDTL